MDFDENSASAVFNLVTASLGRRARPSPIATSFSSSSTRRQHPYDLSVRTSHSDSHSPLSRSLPSSRRLGSASYMPPTASAMPVRVSTPTTPPRSDASSSKLSSPSGSLTASGGRRRKAPAFPSPRHLPRSAPDFPTFSPTTPAALRVPPTPDYSAALLYPSYAPGSASLAPPGMVARHGGSAPTPTSATRSSLHRDPSPRSAKRSRLEGIPKSYVIKSLNSLAQHFWEHPETSDCTVVMPLPRSPTNAGEPSTPMTADSVHSSQPQRSFWPPTPTIPGMLSGRNVVTAHKDVRSRRGSAPGQSEVRVLSFPLHKDYLITQSTLFRTLLSSPAHLDLPMSSPTEDDKSQPPVVSVRSARVLHTPQGSPTTIYVPVPDPASFGVLIHWLYWGNVQALESALSKGIISWQGLVKNIEYLGVDDSVKRVVGKWWRKWVKVAAGRASEVRPAAHSTLGRAYDDASEDEEPAVGDDGAVADVEDETETHVGSNRDDEAVADLLDRL